MLIANLFTLQAFDSALLASVPLVTDTALPPSNPHSKLCIPSIVLSTSYSYADKMAQGNQFPSSLDFGMAPFSLMLVTV